MASNRRRLGPSAAICAKSCSSADCTASCPPVSAAPSSWRHKWRFSNLTYENKLELQA